jgi:4-hydroxy-3-polyprenylbenzoate decarboxylase
MSQRIIVGISGASGIVYGVRALQMLADCGVETHLVMSKSAELTLHHEMDISAAEVQALASRVYPVKNVGAAIASGSFLTRGMLVAPCSVRTMGEIASGVTSTLLTRAADVVLKERRRLVLMLRETPLHTGHLRTMTTLSEMGAVIAPPVPAFYTRPGSLEEVVTQSVGRVLDLFDLDVPGVQRWQGD